MQDLRKFAVIFLEILRHEFRIFPKKRLMTFRCLPPEFVFNDAKITFFIIKNGFSDLKLYYLHTPAIFKKNKNFHVSQIVAKGKNKKSQSLEAILLTPGNDREVTPHSIDQSNQISFPLFAVHRT